MKNYKKQILLFTTISLFSSTSAFALNEQDFADKLAASIEYIIAQKVEFVNVEKKGKNVIITGIKANGVNDDFAKSLSNGVIVFEKVKENKDGSYNVKSANFENIDFTDEEINVKVNDIMFGDLLIPSDPEKNILDTIMLYGAFNVGKISVAKKDKQIFEIDNISVINKANKDKSEFVSNYEVNGIYANLNGIGNEKEQADLASFGLTEIKAQMFGQGVWTLESGRLFVKESVIDVQNIGRLNINMDIFGYTLDVVKKLYDDQKSLVGIDMNSPEYDAKSQAMLMSVASALSFAQFSIRFDDYGITDKALEFAAKEQGTQKEQLVVGLSMMAPAFLAKFNMPELQAQVSVAVSSYLKDPKNIEVKAAPDSPTPFMAFLGLASNPPALIELLNVNVSANQ